MTREARAETGVSGGRVEQMRHSHPEALTECNGPGIGRSSEFFFFFKLGDDPVFRKINSKARLG